MQIDTSSRSNVYQIVSGMMEVIIFLFPNDRLDRFVRESVFLFHHVTYEKIGLWVGQDVVYYDTLSVSKKSPNA